jgi:Contractile injection system tube protein/LysM domain
MALSKALIVVREPPPRIAIPVLFNPPEYSMEVTNQFAEVEVPGLGSSLLQFVHGNAPTLTMDLFFDTTGSGLDVRLHTGLIVSLTDLNPHTHAPPRLLFMWGTLAFPCVLERVNQRFDYFSPAGVPLRAELSVTLRGDEKLERLLAGVPLQSADRAKTHMVRAGDTLQAIAAREYGDPRLWRPIAAASGLDNPLALRVGQQLAIPALQ